MKKLEGNHHEYCKITYKKSKENWRCCCDLLREYDVWREMNTIMNDSEKELKELGNG